MGVMYVTFGIGFFTQPDSLEIHQVTACVRSSLLFIVAWCSTVYSVFGQSRAEGRWVVSGLGLV